MSGIRRLYYSKSPKHSTANENFQKLVSLSSSIKSRKPYRPAYPRRTLCQIEEEDFHLFGVNITRRRSSSIWRIVIREHAGYIYFRDLFSTIHTDNQYLLWSDGVRFVRWDDCAMEPLHI